MPTACGTQPVQMPASGHQSRRILFSHSTGQVPELDGVQRRQLVVAYEGLPADYGHREPYLRSFDDIPAHQDASKCDETGLK